MGAPESEISKPEIQATEPGTNGVRPGDVRVDAGSDPGAAAGAESADEAPWGRKADGTARKRPGRPRGVSGTAEEGASVKDRMGKVRPARPRVKVEVLDQPAALPAPPIGVDHESLGEDAALIWCGVGQIFFGNDWLPELREDPSPGNPFTQEGRAEFNSVRDCFALYFRKKGVNAIDPTVALVVTLAAYTAKKAAKPSVSQKLREVGAWCRKQFSGAMRIFRRGK